MGACLRSSNVASLRQSIVQFVDEKRSSNAARILVTKGGRIWNASYAKFNERGLSFVYHYRIFPTPSSVLPDSSMLERYESPPVLNAIPEIAVKRPQTYVVVMEDNACIALPFPRVIRLPLIGLDPVTETLRQVGARIAYHFISPTPPTLL